MPSSLRLIKRTHAALCYARAFPESPDSFRDARRQLANQLGSLSTSARNELVDTGIGGTAIHYRFSFHVARWLARKAPGAVSIDWTEIDDTSSLDELLTHLLQAAEDEYFDSGQISSREWIDMVRAGCAGTDFDWLMAQLSDPALRSFWAQLYDAADLPLVWDLSESRFCKSGNAFSVRHPQVRNRDLRKRPRFPKQEILRPLESVAWLSRRNGARLIDIAMASLAVRHRETYHFNHANPGEVYLADIGEGVEVAIFGLLPEYRFPLECTMGYLLLSNGVPIGYGGSSIVFRQINTGINIFDEYRAAEASFLWVQIMRVYHSLAGCTRFIANPYQFGADNSEALKSGAFWFYYHLGYRPVSAKIRQLARQETRKLQRDRKYRSDIKTLRKLSACDMHLTLPGARNSDLFEERWLETSSMLATRALGESGGATRAESSDIVAKNLARALALRSLHQWPANERRALKRIAPFLDPVDVAGWSNDSRRAMRKVLRAKGGGREAEFASLLGEHDDFLLSLRRACQRIE